MKFGFELRRTGAKIELSLFSIFKIYSIKKSLISLYDF